MSDFNMIMSAEKFAEICDEQNAWDIGPDEAASVHEVNTCLTEIQELLINGVYVESLEMEYVDAEDVECVGYLTRVSSGERAVHSQRDHSRASLSPDERRTFPRVRC